VSSLSQEDLSRAASAISGAEALLVTAGAGMGVDSGMPYFRGDAGFWREYPPFAKLGLSFSDLANPRWFAEDPRLAWGFYGHRLNLYRGTTPHRGFTTLLAWARRRPRGAFVFTSNVDGHFQKAGFDPDRVVERHGAIGTAQCATPCHEDLFDAPAMVTVDPLDFRAAPPLPTCPRCGGLSRPNILMFGDDAWIESRTEAQARRLDAWLAGLAGGRARVVVLELGAGNAVPTVRVASEAIARTLRGTLVRVNPRDSEVPDGGIGLAAGALEALDALAPLVSE
jgi:NAD-dependent SIR2 family protein deacetylase